MSADLQWLCVRKNSSFIVKNNGLTLTSEPNNLTNVHSFKYNGFVNNKSIGITAGKEGGVVVTKKNSKTNKPSKATSAATIKKTSRGTMNSIKKQTKGYRADLQLAALKRASAILASQKN